MSHPLKIVSHHKKTNQLDSFNARAANACSEIIILLFAYQTATFQL